MRADAATAADRFAVWWRDDYAALASQIAGGLRLERIASNARTAFDQAAERARTDPDVEAAGGLLSDVVPPVPMAHSGSTMRSASLLICLPGTQAGDVAIHWPSGFALARVVRTGEAAAYAA
jgi:hypothetical protein